MAAIDFSYLTDDCRPNPAQLRSDLEALCDATNFTVVDANLGLICGEFGVNSTINSISYDNVAYELTVDAAPAWGALSSAQFVSTTFAPLDVSAVGLYPGVVMPINIVNPSPCRFLAIQMTFTLTNVITYTRDKHLNPQLQDVTGGFPGPVIGDFQRLRFGGSSAITEFIEQGEDITIPTLVAPGGSFTATYQTTMQTLATAAVSGPSLWHQTNLGLSVIGALV